MTRLRNELVLEKWKDGEAASSHNGALSTDGTGLFSYSLKIGHRAKSGATIVGDFTAPGGGFYSVTTSCHVGKARAVAAHTMHPVVFSNSEFKNDKD